MMHTFAIYPQRQKQLQRYLQILAAIFLLHGQQKKYWTLDMQILNTYLIHLIHPELWTLRRIQLRMRFREPALRGAQSVVQALRQHPMVGSCQHLQH